MQFTDPYHSHYENMNYNWTTVDAIFLRGATHKGVYGLQFSIFYVIPHGKEINKNGKYSSVGYI